MEWRQFVMHLGPLPPDVVETVFMRHGAQAITLSDAGDDPVLEPKPGETPLWERSKISGLFPAEADFGALRNDLMHSFELGTLPAWHVEILPDRRWEREWLKDFRPMRFGRRLWVAPGDQTVDARHAVVLKLDPGLAFGTGTHPTTALCLDWLDGRPLGGQRVLDFGCGSGILGIAALLLGADSAVAVDIDPQALLSTRGNAARNGVADRISVCGPDESLTGKFDLAVCNILAGPLRDNAGTLCRLLEARGTLALSGILEHQAAEVAGAYRAWIDFDPPARRDGWVRLTGRRRGS